MSFNQFPSRFGKYILLDRLNAGGMAEVFRAKVTGVEGFERLLAIKCMLPSMLEDEQFIGMFVDEARLAAQVGHANIAQIYELGREQERLYIAMELVHGRDLRNIIKTAEAKGIKLPPQFAAYVASKAAEGLDFAHRKEGVDGKPLGLVHRDVSPQNILVSYDGEVKLVDFGIAKASSGARGTQTQVGVLKGKFAYMAPEQVSGSEIDRRADIFALGSVLYEMVVGKRLFRGESDLTVLEKVREGTLPDFNVELPAEAMPLVPVLHKALALAVDDRFSWASEMAEALEPTLIEERSIFGSKRAAVLMRTLFADETAQLAEDLKRFGEVTVSQCVNFTTDVSQAPAGGARMVFESAFSPAGKGDDDTGVLKFDPIPLDVDAAPPPLPARATGAATPAIRLTLRRDANAGAARAPSGSAPPPLPAASLDKRRREVTTTQKGTVPSYFAAEPTPIQPRRSGASEAPAPNPSRRTGATDVRQPLHGTGRVLRRLKIVFAVALLLISGLMVTMALSTKSSLGLQEGISQVQTIKDNDWLSTLVQQARRSAWIDRWLFGSEPASVQHTNAHDFPLPVLPDAPQDNQVHSDVPVVPKEGFVRVEVTGAPRARISIDGKDMGSAPLPPVSLPLGQHHVQVIHTFPSGLTQSRDARVRLIPQNTQDSPVVVTIDF